MLKFIARSWKASPVFSRSINLQLPILQLHSPVVAVVVGVLFRVVVQAVAPARLAQLVPDSPPLPSQSSSSSAYSVVVVVEPVVTAFDVPPHHASSGIPDGGGLGGGGRGGGLGGDGLLSSGLRVRGSQVDGDQEQ